MKTLRHVRPFCETLDDRWCPAITLSPNTPNPGDLTITGFTANATNTLRLEFTSPTDVDVFDGAILQGSPSVTGNLVVNLSGLAAGQTIDVNLGGLTFTGNMNITVGNAVIPNGNTIIFNEANGTVVGNVTIGTLTPTQTGTGTGNDSVIFDNNNNVNGSVFINTMAGNDTVSFLGGSSVSSNLSVHNANSFTLSNTSTIGGNFVLNTPSESIAMTVNLLNGSTITGNATVTTGLAGDTVNLSGTISGIARFNLGHGVNSLTLFGTATMQSDLFITGGNQRDVVLLNGTILNNLTVNLGNSGITAATGNELTINGFVAGTNLQVIGGNGVDQVTFNGSANGATFRALLGSGNDTLTLNSNILARGIFDGGFGTDTILKNVPTNYPFSQQGFEL